MDNSFTISLSALMAVVISEGMFSVCLLLWFLSRRDHANRHQ